MDTAVILLLSCLHALWQHPDRCMLWSCLPWLCRSNTILMRTLLVALQRVSEASPKPQRQQQQQQLNQAQRPAVGNPEAGEDAEEVPEQVYSRILARILTFTGLPVFVGMLLFPLFYYLKVCCCSGLDSIASLGCLTNLAVAHQHDEVAA